MEKIFSSIKNSVTIRRKIEKQGSKKTTKIDFSTGLISSKKIFSTPLMNKILIRSGTKIKGRSREHFR